MLPILQPPVDHRLVQAGVPTYFLLAIREPLRGLAELPVPLGLPNACIHR
jgi:hypothetical protein